MAARKKTQKDVTTASLTHGRQAAGAKYLREGFGFTADDDIAWALGFPYVRYLTDDAPTKVGPHPFVVFDEHQLTFPRATAVRIVRGYHHRPAPPGCDISKATKEVRKRVESTSELGVDEVSELIRSQVHHESDWYLPQRFGRMLLLAEALVGSVPVAHAVVDALERIKLSDKASNFEEVVAMLGFMLLRVPPDVSDALHARLRKRLAGKEIKVASKGAAQRDLYRTLDLVLEGKRAIPRSADGAPHGYATRPSLLWVNDDPSFLRSRLRRDDDCSAAPEARLVFLGGDEVLDFELAWMDRYQWPSPRSLVHRILSEHYAPIRSPKLVPLMLRLSRTKGGKRAALAWFSEHAAYARPHLEKLARGPGGDAAKQLLADLA